MKEERAIGKEAVREAYQAAKARGAKTSVAAISTKSCRVSAVAGKGMGHRWPAG